MDEAGGAGFSSVIVTVEEDIWIVYLSELCVVIEFKDLLVLARIYLYFR